MFGKARRFQWQPICQEERRRLATMAHQGIGTKKRDQNFVHTDEIWKDHVRHEHVSSRHKWPETWGYLVDEYKAMHQQLAGHPKSSKTPRTPRTPVKLPPIQPVPKRSPGFPVTASQQIGWRSANPDCVLEKYGAAPFAKGKCTLIRRMNWPANCLC